MAGAEVETREAREAREETREAREETRETRETREAREETRETSSLYCHCGSRSWNETRIFEIKENVEMVKMAFLFFGKYWPVLYFCLFFYLSGDLAIYWSAVAKSLSDVICTCDNGCWVLDRFTLYRVIVCLFGFSQFILVAFEDITRFKFMQVISNFCTAYRLVAFAIMIGLASKNFSSEIFHQVPTYDFDTISHLFGVCIYSFTCHHSLPHIITPISKKNCISMLVFLEYLTIFSFYLGLAFTGISAFDTVNGLYTFNFQPEAEEHWMMKGIFFSFFKNNVF